MLRILALRLVHCVIALGEFFLGFIRYFPHLDALLSKKRLAGTIEADAKYLRKLPLHVGFVVVEKTFSYKDLANIIVWSVTMGVSYVSIYDLNGEIKRNCMQLQKEVEQSKAALVFEDQLTPDICIYSHDPQHSEKWIVGSGGRKASIHLLSAEDGCQALVQAARRLSCQVTSHLIAVKDISPCSVDSLIHDFHQFPDPDLCIKFGSLDCLMGYLPWQIRLTEIISIPSHHGLSYHSFLSSLHLYAKTEQRYGK